MPAERFCVVGIFASARFNYETYENDSWTVFGLCLVRACRPIGVYLDSPRRIEPIRCDYPVQWRGHANGGAAYPQFDDNYTNYITSYFNENNLIYNCNADGNTNGGTCSSVFGPLPCVFDYSLVNAGAVGMANVYVASNENEHAYFSYAQAHGQSSAPTFVSYVTNNPANNFHPQSSSAGVGQGVNLTTILPAAAFDKDGNARPGGSTAWDIGAYNHAP
jgi:hypothetical protein